MRLAKMEKKEKHRIATSESKYRNSNSRRERNRQSEEKREAIAWFFAFVLIATCGLLSGPGLCQARTARLDVYLDLDGDPGTGCAVVSAEGTMDGGEQILATEVDADEMVVGRVFRLVCADGEKDRFSDPADVSGGGWSVGVAKGVGGADTVETFLPLSAATPGNLIRVGFGSACEDADGDSLLGESGDGFAILFGTPPAAVPVLDGAGIALLGALLFLCAVIALRKKKHGGTSAIIAVLLPVALSGIAFALFLPDGMVAEWDDTDPLGLDALGDGEPDIAEGFMKMESDRLAFRIDASFPWGPECPVAADMDFSTLEDSAFTGNLIVPEEDRGTGVPDAESHSTVVVSVNGDDAAVGIEVALESGGSPCRPGRRVLRLRPRRKIFGTGAG